MRLIDADELKKKAKMIDWLCNKQVVSVEDIDNSPTENITALCPVDFPTIDDPYPCCSYKRPQGEWIRYKDDPHQPEHIKCSNCGQYWSIADHDKIFDFCFKCGADMRGDKK